jgi:DNA primase
LREHAITQDIAIKYTLGFVSEPLPGDERFTGMLSIPYLTPAGVRAMKFRSLSTEGAKYHKHSGDKNRLYNAPAYFEAGTAIGISEGEMDAIAASEHLNVPTLGVPGTQGWKSAWRHVLEDFTTVYIFGDGDQPGRAFADEMAELVGWRARIVQCPDGEDVSSMAASGRASELLAKMSTKGEEQ